MQERTSEERPLDAHPGGAPAVRLVGVRKSYGDVVAVDGVDLEIQTGEFFTLLGPFGLGQDDDAASDRGFRAPG